MMRAIASAGPHCPRTNWRGAVLFPRGRVFSRPPSGQRRRARPLGPICVQRHGGLIARTHPTEPVTPPQKPPYAIPSAAAAAARRFRPPSAATAADTAGPGTRTTSATSTASSRQRGDRPWPATAWGWRPGLWAFIQRLGCSPSHFVCVPHACQSPFVL